LRHNREGAGSGDYRVALSKSALGASLLNNHAPAQLPDLGVEDFEIRGVRLGFQAAKHLDGPRQQGLLPFRDCAGSAAFLSPLNAAKAT
jgi:hypothetical protein